MPVVVSGPVAWLSLSLGIAHDSWWSLFLTQQPQPLALGFVAAQNVDLQLLHLLPLVLLMCPRTHSQ